MVGAQQAQSRNGEKIRRETRELKAKRDYAGLAQLPGCQPDTAGESLFHERSAPWLHAQVWLLPLDVPGSGVEWPDSRRHQGQLVSSRCPEPVFESLI
jgi:hypothetical protein